ncbi:MAG TPA: hypothetical protein VGX68_26500 [Thermoanaerobaculia bacterium]|jgi:hypothetical protein|nr:hypothetical protein [Thermoanaerobaculia bacterium]
METAPTILRDIRKAPTVIRDRVRKGEDAKSILELVLDFSDEGRERWTQVVEEWSREAVAEIRALTETLREHGVANLAEVLEAVDQAARANDRARLQALESIRKSKAIGNDMRRQARQYARTLPEMVPQFQQMAEKADRQAARLERQAKTYDPILDAYRDALRVLLDLRNATIMDSCLAATFEELLREKNGTTDL